MTTVTKKTLVARIADQVLRANRIARWLRICQIVYAALSALGFLMLALRVFDALSDPLIGALSDRTRTRFGRRRPWIVLGSLPLAASLQYFYNVVRPDKGTQHDLRLMLEFDF